MVVGLRDKHIEDGIKMSKRPTSSLLHSPGENVQFINKEILNYKTFNDTSSCLNQSATFNLSDKQKQLSESSKMLTRVSRKSRNNNNTFLFGLILQALLVLLVLIILIDNHTVCAMSKRFLKGFIMGAMFAHHHKP